MRDRDEIYMREAIEEAKIALSEGEVPVGAVGVVGGEIIARAHNVREFGGDPLGHAELVLIRSAARKLGDWRLTQLEIYSTLEPCIMCMGAIMQVRVGRLVFGAPDIRWGGCGSLYDLSCDLRLGHRIEVKKGVLEDECADLLKEFFRSLRKDVKDSR